MRARVGRALGTGATVVLIATWVLLLRPVALGGTATWVVVRGDSMEPVYSTGDLVIVRQTSDYRIGDIVAYRVPAGEIGAGSVVIHRLTGGDAVNGFEALGDNNDDVDPWYPRQPDMIGREWIAVPGVGRLIAWLHDPIILAGLIAALVVAYVVSRPEHPRAARAADSLARAPDPAPSRGVPRSRMVRARSAGAIAMMIAPAPAPR